MKPIKPKFDNTVKMEVHIAKKTKEILAQYAKYTKYSESQIIDILACEIIEDDNEFVEWLKSRRFNKKAYNFIFDDEKEGLEDYEETEEACDDF